MTIFLSDDTSIYYEEYGEGPTVLLIAPGGMKSTIQAWSMAPWNPIDVLKESFHVVAMDQRNAGQSTGNIHKDDGWHTYTKDQLKLMDHLGVDHFIVAGMCIGGPYIFSLLQEAEERVDACVVFQSIGRDDNREEFYNMFENWAAELKSNRGDVLEESLSGLRENMFGGDKKLFSVDDEFLAKSKTPMCVLMGSDIFHPESTSRLIAQEVRECMFIEKWKDGPNVDIAKNQVLEFLLSSAIK